MTKLETSLLDLLREDCRLPLEKLAVMTGATIEEVAGVYAHEGTLGSQAEAADLAYLNAVLHALAVDDGLRGLSQLGRAARHASGATAQH